MRIASSLLLLALLGCGEGTATPQPVPQEPPEPPLAGELLIEELYYSGAAPNGGTDHYFSDQFVELVNASDHPLDLSGVMIGDAYGVAGPINPGTEPNSFRDARPNEVVMSSLWRLPGKTILQPGAHLVIAHDGTNHRPFSTIDLSVAHFESFVATSDKDEDHPTVANLESVVFNGGFDWLVPVFGASIVVLSADAPLGDETSPLDQTLVTAPVTSVLDAVEALLDGNAAAFKRLPDSVDRGHAFVSGTYVGESLHRRRSEDGWQDSGDAAADFVVGLPDPTFPSATEGVFGDPWLEVGTGRSSFVAIAAGANVELVAGIQGGWHLDASLRFGGLGPDGVVVRYEVLTQEGKLISFATKAFLTSASVLEDGDAFVRVGDRAVLDIADPAEVVGTTAILRATVELGGQTWSDSRTVVIVDEQ